MEGGICTQLGVETWTSRTFLSHRWKKPTPKQAVELCYPHIAINWGGRKEEYKGSCAPLGWVQPMLRENPSTSIIFWHRGFHGHGQPGCISLEPQPQSRYRAALSAFAGPSRGGQMMTQSKNSSKPGFPLGDSHISTKLAWVCLASREQTLLWLTF